MSDNLDFITSKRFVQMLIGVAANTTETVNVLCVGNPLIMREPFNTLPAPLFFALTMTEVTGSGNYEALPSALEDVARMETIRSDLGLRPKQDYNLQAGAIVLRTGIEIAARMSQELPAERIENIAFLECIMKSSNLLGTFLKIDPSQLSPICESIRAMARRALEKRGADRETHIRSVIQALILPNGDKNILPLYLKDITLADPRAKMVLVAMTMTLVVSKCMDGTIEMPPAAAQPSARTKAAMRKFLRPEDRPRERVFPKNLLN